MTRLVVRRHGYSIVLYYLIKVVNKFNKVIFKTLKSRRNFSKTSSRKKKIYKTCQSQGKLHKELK